MSLYKGNNLISGAMPNSANQSLSNLNSAGQDKFDKKVNKSGDTMTGDLQILSSVDPQIVIKHTEQVAGTTPTSEVQATRIEFQDSNGTMVGYVQNAYDTDGSRATRLNSRNANGTENTSIIVGYNANGTAYSFFPNTTCCDGQFVNKTTQIMSNVSLNGSSVLTYTLSDLPNDGHSYFVWLSGIVTTGTTSGNYIHLSVYSDAVSNNLEVCATGTRTASSVVAAGSVVIPVSSSRKIYVVRSTNYNGTASLWLKGYRRIGTNS